MGIKRVLVEILEKLTNSRIFRRLPHGISVIDDIERQLINYRLNIIFDIGANTGQSASSYLSLSPLSIIYCFEPILKTFNELKFNMNGKKQVKCFQLAFGSREGSATMISNGISTMNCLVDENHLGLDEQTELVSILPLDGFCEANNVDHISYLKIDTEGADLDVLKGADKMLATKSVDFIEVEAGMNPNNKYHESLEVLKSFLESHGYYIFGIYEQVNEWPVGDPHLRRVNAVFISEKMISDYRRV